jgi:hypothetical protein
MSTITLTNDFHNTTVTLRCEVLSHIHNVSTAYLSAGQIKRAKRELCGIAGCTCSGDAGLRGRQEHDGKRLEVNIDSLFANR